MSINALTSPFVLSTSAVDKHTHTHQ